MALTYDLGQLERFADRLVKLGDGDAPVAIVEGLADLWVDTAKQRMGHDTWQLDNRTELTRLDSTGSKATARVEADTPYAGFHNYGTRYVPPNRFWNHGRDAAEQKARQIGGQIESQIRRSLTSGGSWNPRSLF